MHDTRERRLIQRGHSLLITLPPDCLIVLGVAVGDMIYCRQADTAISLLPTLSNSTFKYEDPTHRGWLRKLFPIAGSSVGVVLPAEHVKSLGWVRGMVVYVEPSEDGVLVHLAGEDTQEAAGDDWEPGDEAREVLAMLDAAAGE
jgi:antitoxin component of MazEF toxin-antitoxin module